MRKLALMALASLVAALGLFLGLSDAAPTGAKSVVNKTAPVVRSVSVPGVSVHRVSVKSASSESSSETAAKTAAEKAAETGTGTETDKHEDPPGQDVNHECPPNCDTANGEQP